MTENISSPLDSILAKIRYHPTGANAIEARIAATILEDPDRVARESIVAFARRAVVSTGSVVRFAKLVGLNGYQDLRLALAASSRELASRSSPQRQSRFRDYLDEQVRGLLFAVDQVDATAVEEAAAVIVRSRRIDIVGTGASTSACQALLFWLTLLGLHVRFLPESSEQSAAAGFLEASDSLIVVSFSGRTRSAVDAAARATAAGATVIALTCNHRAPLLRNASIALVLDTGSGRFTSEWPLRTAMHAVAVALCLTAGEYVAPEVRSQRRGTWSAGRFGIRYPAV